MKVALINTYFRQGGAAIACQRLANALAMAGTEVVTICSDGTYLPNGQKIAENSRWLDWKWKLNKNIERLEVVLNNHIDKKKMWKVSLGRPGLDLSKHTMVQTADILHIHWVNHGFLSIDGLRKLLDLGKPIVWTMHDMWPFTGICHYSGTCENYTSSCRACHLLNSSGNDISTSTQKAKAQLFVGRENQVKLVGCSKWLTNLAKKSTSTSHLSSINIPNPINTSLFKPLNKVEVKKQLGLNPSKKNILFAAENVFNVEKGFVHLVEALKEMTLEEKGQIQLVIIGKTKEQLDLGIETKYMGYISDASTLVNLYNAANLFVTPSLQDNLPNTVMESLACGTPVVAFETGGIPEMVDHKINGYIACYKDAKDLASGMAWALFEADGKSLSENARKKVVESYSEEVIAKRYLKLYGEFFT